MHGPLFRRNDRRRNDRRTASQSRTFSGRRLLLERLEERRLLTANGSDTRHYRLAVAATEEYTAFYGDDRSAAQAEIARIVDDANVVLQRELNVQLDLLDNTAIIYGGDNPAPDPYSSDVLSALEENQTVLDSVVGETAYDVGWVLGTFFDGGRAVLGGAGVDELKGKFGVGLSETPFGPGSPQYLDILLHELGHHFAAEHTFNSTDGACGAGSGDGRIATAAWEPGSGSTLMSYAGICPAVPSEPPAGDNVQNFADPYYHAGSLAQIFGHLETLDGLGVGSHSGANAIPTIDLGAEFTIPAATPFMITASGADADDPDGDRLRYTIEQLDVGPAQSIDPASDNGASPLFRSFAPVAANAGGEFVRHFPQLGDILTGVPTKGELLPTTDRSLTLRGTVRDQDGGSNSDEVVLTVVDTGAAFAVTSPNTSAPRTGGALTTVAWDVAGTTAAPISTSMVEIHLSTDRGETFPYLLATTANDGSHDVLLPNLDASAARIRVSGAGNIFFDISDIDFAITAAAATAGLTLTQSAGSADVGEGGLIQSDTDSYTLALNTAPTAAVTVSITADAQSLVSLDGATFMSSVSAARSDTSPLTVFVRAVDDSAVEGAHHSLITHAITASSDAAYPTSLVLPAVVANLVDDELAPLVAVDFQSTLNSGGSPKHWNVISESPELDVETTFPGLIRETGGPTGIDLTITPSADSTSFSGQELPLISLTLPEHTQSLAPVDDVLRWRVPSGSTAPTSVDLKWGGLAPGARYRVFLFAGEFTTELMNQTVTITGAGTDDPAPFVQLSTDGTRTFERRLFVNDRQGQAFRDLDSYGKLVTSNAAGEITISVTRDDDVSRNRIFLAGAAISEAFVVPPVVEIDVEKLVEGVDADAPPGPTFTVGEMVTFEYRVTNPGETPLASVAVVDDAGTGDMGDDFSPTFVDGDGNGNSLLDVGETWTYEASHTVVEGAYASLATATAVDSTGAVTEPVSDSDPNHLVGSVAPPTLTLSLDETTIEEGGTATLTITRSSNVSFDDPLTVTLDSSDTAELTLPDDATILAGEPSTTVVVTAEADGVIDGPKSVDVTATATSFTDGTTSASVVDPGHPFPWHWAVFPEDVDTDGSVIPFDITEILGELVLRGSRALTPSDPLVRVPPYVDVVPDNVLDAQDLAQVIAFLILDGSGGEGEFAGAAPTYPATPPLSTSLPESSPLPGRSEDRLTPAPTLAPVESNFGSLPLPGRPRGASDDHGFADAVGSEVRRDRPWLESTLDLLLGTDSDGDGD